MRLNALESAASVWRSVVFALRTLNASAVIAALKRPLRLKFFARRKSRFQMLGSRLSPIGAARTVSAKVLLSVKLIGRT